MKLICVKFFLLSKLTFIFLVLIFISLISILFSNLKRYYQVNTFFFQNFQFLTQNILDYFLFDYFHIKALTLVFINYCFIFSILILFNQNLLIIKIILIPSSINYLFSFKNQDFSKYDLYFVEKEVVHLLLYF